MGAILLPQFNHYPNLAEALTASVHGQLRGDKECPFSGVSRSGRVWRKVPESDARSVPLVVTLTQADPINVRCSGRVAEAAENEAARVSNLVQTPPMIQLLSVPSSRQSRT